jgi:hypothetical protein
MQQLPLMVPFVVVLAFVSVTLDWMASALAPRRQLEVDNSTSGAL